MRGEDRVLQAFEGPFPLNELGSRAAGRFGSGSRHGSETDGDDGAITNTKQHTGRSYMLTLLDSTCKILQGNLPCYHRVSIMQHQPAWLMEAKPIPSPRRQSLVPAAPREARAPGAMLSRNGDMDIWCHCSLKSPGLDMEPLGKPSNLRLICILMISVMRDYL